MSVNALLIILLEYNECKLVVKRNYSMSRNNPTKLIVRPTAIESY